jgi:hypothetical protein
MTHPLAGSSFNQRAVSAAVELGEIQPARLNG